ncbi:FtsX-like permease family protein [Maribellus comscasis]|uniref:FtsX-like permease family protein n=1 Tax=Maribellus comscasis TaxID=2681766 RepID=A0A6I6JWW9_9BACT|nr:ABC transporter permease [Maribellus comscasis]QGY44652.1 FtsX-like permease family protein [Maribellus comscasis]
MTTIIRYIKATFRNAIRNKYISLLNLFGLSVGITSTLLLILWVSHELSFDHFFANSENIYQVIFMGEQNNKEVKVCSTPQGIGVEAEKLFPEVINFTRIRKHNRAVLKVGDKQFYAEKGFYADSTFFSVFSFEGKFGDLSNSLNKPDQVVIDEYLAAKCFSTKYPVGENISINGRDYTVSAVVKNVASNSHLQFHYLIPVLNLSEGWQNTKWTSDNCFQYLVVNHAAKIPELEIKLTNMVTSKFTVWKQLNAFIKLQPLHEIHFRSEYILDYAVLGNKQNVFVLALISFLILLIACVNFTNIFISTSLKRTKSTGIKMASGANKAGIIKEFAFEVLLFIFISFLISFGLIYLMLPVFNNLVHTEMPITIFNLKFVSISFVVIILTLLMSGLFPGLYITRFNVVSVLKSGYTGLKGNKNKLQRSLVTIQFIIAIILIISVLGIQKQVYFLQHKQLGFDKDKVLYVRTYGELENIRNIKLMASELSQNPNIVDISSRSSLPTQLVNGGQMQISSNPDHKVHGERVEVGEGYFDLMNIKFVEGGQKFDYSNDQINTCIINEIAAKRLLLKPPYCGQFVFDLNQGHDLKIIGVIPNINTKSLNSEITPCLYTKASNYNGNGVVLFRLAGNLEPAIKQIKDYCEKNNSAVPFEYHFLDEVYDNLYVNEIQIQKMLIWFSVISILLTSLGLFAMSFFITEKRTKEIGIRKVNGARIFEILTILNKDFVKWVIIALVIATPIAYYAMNKWLENFAYKTTLSWWIFALAGVLALGIALLTVSFQSWKAATRNPVEALRYE